MPLPQLSKAVFGFFGSRVVIMVGTFCVVLLNTHYLGAEGQGTASLINFGILLVVALSNFVGGGALVYLIPRLEKGSTVLPSLGWAVMSAVIMLAIFLVFPFLPQEYVWHIAVLGLMQSLFVYLSQISLAAGDSRAYNVSVSVQSASLPVSLFVLLGPLGWRTPTAVVVSLYISFALTLLFFLAYTLHHLKHTKVEANVGVWKQMFGLGKYAQGGNILHILNQRMSVVMLENLAANGRAMAGIFSIAMYGAEVLWAIPKSLSVDQYSRISNSNNWQEQRSITNGYLRIAGAVVFTGALAALLIPQWLYDWVMQRDLAGLRETVLWLIPGIVVNSFSIILAHFFSGTGRHRFNFYASGLGLLAGVAIGFAYIPAYGTAAAAAATSIAFALQFLYFVYVYLRDTPEKALATKVD
jgi:O-antigen/teichoic acid export membrane protein